MKLQKVLVAIAFSLFAAAAAAAEADPPAAIGRLNHVAGPVSFAPAQAPEDWAAATLNRPITTGDRLWTDSGGRAEMHVGSLAVRMDSQTSLDVLKLDDSGLQLRLAQGNANLRVRRGESDQPVEIATPGGAVVLTRPGSYRVNVDPRGSVTSVTVRRGGQAEVFARNGSFLVSDGQQATVGDSRQDLAAAPGPDEFDHWTAKRDQREDRIASTRYVPAEMTGYEDLDEHGTWRTVPQYGAVWQPRAVPAGWAPYRHGHWVWVAPWGWTWVDDAPWGFAPSHYGRWVWLGNHWAWAPGRIVERPVYAPAMVAFIGGSNFSVSVGVGTAPAVAWVPLGWREPYRPWYRASHTHVRNVNVTHVTNVTNITNNVTNVRLVNRNAPSAVTVVSRENFVAARAVRPAALKVSQRTIAAAPVAKGAPVDAPERASLAQGRSGTRPPAEVRSRETVAVNTPPAPAREAERAERKGKGRDEARVASRDSDDRPRVRVIDRQRRMELQAAQTPASSAAQPQVKAGERAQDKAASKPQPAPQAERRVPAPPADVAKRPTFDHEMRQVAPQADAQRGQAERAERREQKAGEAGRPPQAQVAPQPGNRAGPPQAPDTRRAKQQQEQQRAREQQTAREQQAQEQRAREQQAQRQQQAQEQQARRQAEKRQPEQRQEERQQRAQPDERAQVQQQAQQRAQEQAQQQQARERAQEQAQQRAQQQAQQRAQQQAQQRAQEQAQQRAQQQAQQQAQQRAQEQARQQQQAQRAQPQAQQQAREQQAQQRAQQQAQKQQQAQQQQQQQARQQRRDQPQEKGGRERARQDKDKAEKG